MHEVCLCICMLRKWDVWGWDALEMHNLCTVYMWAMEKGVGGTRLAMHHLCQTQLLVCHTPDSCRDFFWCRTAMHVWVGSTQLKQPVYYRKMNFETSLSISTATVQCVVLWWDVNLASRPCPRTSSSFPTDSGWTPRSTLSSEPLDYRTDRMLCFYYEMNLKGQWTQMGAIWVLLFLWH